MSLVEKAMPISGDTFSKTLIHRRFYEVSKSSGPLYVVSSDGTTQKSTDTYSIDDDRILLISMDYDITNTSSYVLTNATVEWSGRESGVPLTNGGYVASVKKTDKSKPIKIKFVSNDYRAIYYMPIAFE